MSVKLSLDGRTDMTGRATEAWRPPVFMPTRSVTQRFIATARRFLDLQAGTAWRDLSAILPTCEGVVLDVGCGAQPFRALIGPRSRYIGIDTADAKAHFGYEIPDTIYFDGDRWPVEDGSVDVVLCTETLEHVRDTLGFLSEAGRVLRSAGSIVLTVPFAARYHFIPHDYWRFTPASLAYVLTAAGFESVAVYARGNAVTVACYKVMALILPLLLSPAPSIPLRIVRGVVGIALSPLVLLLAIIGQISARGRGGDDCLGYTVLARKGDDR